VHQRKVDEQNCRRDPRPRRDSGAKRQYRAPKIKWVTRVRVGPGRGENGLLVQVAGSVGANAKADSSHERADDYRARCRLGKPQHKTPANTPDSTPPPGE